MITLESCSLESLNASEAFLQTGFWGEFKSAQGWEARGFRGVYEEAGLQEPFTLLVLLKRLTRGLTLAYLPHGPSSPVFLPAADTPPPAGLLEARLLELAAALKPQLPQTVMALRFDLLSGTLSVPMDPSENEEENSPSGETFPPPLARPFVKPAADVQPADTVLLDLTPQEETILGRMKKKTRYNVKLAEKKGIVVTQGGLGDLAAWYDLYRQTGERDKISLHGYDYYLGLFKASEKARSEGRMAPRMILLLASYEGRLLAGNLVLVHGRQGVYLYGASSNEHRNLMAPYALQWKAIQLCKESGCVEYDLFGIPPTDDETHPMHGLYRFKTGFGGVIIHRHGAWDLRWKPWAWSLIHQFEKARIWYYKKWRKR